MRMLPTMSPSGVVATAIWSAAMSSAIVAAVVRVVPSRHKPCSAVA